MPHVGQKRTDGKLSSHGTSNGTRRFVAENYVASIAYPGEETVGSKSSPDGPYIHLTVGRIRCSPGPTSSVVVDTVNVEAWRRIAPDSEVIAWAATIVVVITDPIPTGW